MPDQTQLGERVSLWTSLLHLRAGVGLTQLIPCESSSRVARNRCCLDSGQVMRRSHTPREKRQSREHLVRFSVADEQLAVGSLSALDLLWLGDSAEAQGDEAICEAALRCALRVAGRSGLARTVAELDDRLGESPRSERFHRAPAVE